MGNKIGRNDKCPCGSGKKFKNCCIDKGAIFENEGKNDRFNIRDFFSQFHKIDLAVTISALSIHPANHGKNLRLDYLLIEALASRGGLDSLIDSERLKKILDDKFPYFHLEDPPENMFTENVIFSTGNNTVYGGNFEQGVFTLNNLIKVINYFKESLPEGFRKTISDACHLLLFLSNIVTLRVGHTRNMPGEYSQSKGTIEFPDELEKFKNAVWFDQEWINKYTKGFGIDIDVLKHFIITPLDIKPNEISIQNIEGNPVLIKPLLQLPDWLIMIAPTNVVGSLVHFIWVQAERLGCRTELVNLFHKIVYKELKFFIKKINYKRLPLESEINGQLPIKFLLYKFDTDKLAFVSFSYDEGESYNATTPCQGDPMTKMSEVVEHKDKVLKEIKANHKDYKILVIDLYSSIGREYMLLGIFDEDYGIMTSVYRFLIWLKSDHHDKMRLWYFERQKEAFTQHVQIAPFVTFLDLFSVYGYKKDSFYLNDDARPTDLYIPPGEGFNIIQDGVINEDCILANYFSYDRKERILVPVIKADEHILRYANRETQPECLEFYIPNLPVDIWVRSGKKIVDMKEHSSIYWEFSETICYWILQVSDELKTHLEQLKLAELDLIYDFDKLPFFEDHSIAYKKDYTVVDGFDLQIDSRHIKIIIPKKIEAFIGSPDNDGERILLSKILTAFGLLLLKNGLPNSLDQKNIERIIDKHAPSGLKKMLLLLQTENDITLDPRFLIKPRYVQNAIEQLILDEIIPALGNKCPPIGEIIEKDKKLALINKASRGRHGPA